jgi:hypothetical protein
MTRQRVLIHASGEEAWDDERDALQCQHECFACGPSLFNATLKSLRRIVGTSSEVCVGMGVAEP